ncbi:phosphotransferase [Microlunatus sp. GCM10028923]|uniref:phosphotransferase n=1 Tax=Microlunatus sp. GCM10028923 TaxID=3273400 RepID=UPI00361F1C0B
MEAWSPTADTVPFLIERFALPYATGSLTSVARGSMGQVWRLDLAEPRVRDPGVAGDRLMIKQFFWGADGDAEHRAQAEAEFCQAAAASGLILTVGIPAADGGYVQRLATHTGEVVLRLNTWAGGCQLRREDPGRAEYLGSTLGTLHALRYPAESQPDPYFTTPPSDDSWNALLVRVGQEDRRIPNLARLLNERIAELVALGHLVDTAPQTDLIFSHRDVQPANVLRDGASGALTLIDWDEAGPVSPSRELASQLCVWHVHDAVVQHDVIRRTVRAYRDAGGYGAVDSLATFSLRLANDLNYIHDEVLAALDDDLPEDLRKHAEREAEHFIAATPTRIMLEAIIDAATS